MIYVFSLSSGYPQAQMTINCPTLWPRGQWFLTVLFLWFIFMISAYLEKSQAKPWGVWLSVSSCWLDDKSSPSTQYTRTTESRVSCDVQNSYQPWSLVPILNKFLSPGIVGLLVLFFCNCLTFFKGFLQSKQSSNFGSTFHVIYHLAPVIPKTSMKLWDAFWW